MSLQQVPASLRTVPQWLVWQRSPAGTKLPVRRAGDQWLPAPAADPSTWLTFEQACELVSEHDELSGLGLCPLNVRRDGWALVLIDCDHVLDEHGKLLPQYEDVAAFFDQHDMYVEKSPSGTGLRSACWVPETHPLVSGTYRKVSLPDGTPLGEVFSGGYCTITGDVVQLPRQENAYVGDIDRWLVGKAQAAEAVDAAPVTSVQWEEAQPLEEASGLSGPGRAVLHGEGGVDRSHHMLPLLASLSWQCSSVEELAARAWATPSLHQYFVDHREQRAEVHQKEFCLSECSKAWARRDAHKPAEAAFQLAVEETAKDSYHFALQWATGIHMDPPAWQYRNVIPRSGSLMFWGPANAGKTWMSASHAVASAMQRPWMGIPCTQPNPRKRLHVYLASEGVAGLLQRIRGLHAAYGGGELPLLVNTYDSKITEDFLARLTAEIDAYCAATEYELSSFTVDTYVGHSTAKENSADEVEAWLSSIRRTVTGPRDALLVMNHHAGKDGEVRGSSNLTGFFDVIWRVRQPAAFIEMDCTKVRDYDKAMLAPLAVELAQPRDGWYLLQQASPAAAAATAPPPPAAAPTADDMATRVRVESERLICQLVHEKVVLRAEELPRSAAYEQLRQQVHQVRGVLPLPATELHPLVLSLLADGVLQLTTGSRGPVLSLAQPWTDELELRRLGV